MKVFVEAYGCTLNRGEADEFTDWVLESGHAAVTSGDDADAIAIFTCGVIETTERHMLKRISELAKLNKKLFICGCLGDISPKRVLDVAPDAVLISPAEHWRVLEMLGEGIKRPSEHDSKIDSAVGILPVATGCVGECAYCVTRLARGELKSRPENVIIERAKKLVLDGCAEIQLCAQDTAAYGIGEGRNIHGLVSKLASLEGNFMIRIGMMNPGNALPRIDCILEMYEKEKVFKFLHLPVQSGSDDVLSRMKRDYSVDDFKTVVGGFRERFPDGVVSTDIITGFPGETDEEFEMSYSLMEKIKPDIVNITRFSARPGTPAAKMKDQIPSRIAKDRSRLLTDLRFEISKEKYVPRAGKSVNALATEYRQAGTTFLRTKDYWPVVVDGTVPLGKWYKIELGGSEKTHLIGEIYPNP